MGWSCARDAGFTLDVLSKCCVCQTGSQNVFEENGEKFFFETSRREHADGAITGKVWRFLPDGNCRQSGSFRIEPNGWVSRGPKFLKDCDPTLKANRQKPTSVS